MRGPMVTSALTVETMHKAMRAEKAPPTLTPKRFLQIWPQRGNLRQDSSEPLCQHRIHAAVRKRVGYENRATSVGHDAISLLLQLLHWLGLEITGVHIRAHLHPDLLAAKIAQVTGQHPSLPCLA